MTLKEIIKAVEETEKTDFVTAKFGKHWKENARENFDFDSLLELAHTQGRKLVLFERFINNMINDSEEIKIESGKEIPRPNKFKYPFDKMKVGDSFLADKVYSRHRHSQIISCAKNWADRNSSKFKFTSRKTEEGIRVWRVS